MFTIAIELNKDYPEFNINKFEADMVGSAGINLFKEDIEKVKKYNVTQFPSLLFQHENTGAILIPGFRTFEFLEKEFLKFREKTGKKSSQPLEKTE